MSNVEGYAGSLCAHRAVYPRLERLVRAAPQTYLCDALVFNLCTLYDLSNDNRASARKKRVLQGVAERYMLDDIDPASFRIG